MHVTIRGFVTNMEEWMGACDAIVTKAGPGTIAESLISGLPMVLNGFIPCQEAGNVPFVVDNKVRSLGPWCPCAYSFSHQL
jgi:1,2-diacylglycerol 3-beta-galactosyltransferase